ncbi:protealysin inhibitor emfourin [Actinacidiphila alni]|uniref:protealysin inhibitor emfourin n=1 Tax=Actinacidiphila alni TaxID=380248 RepID=UPI003453767E
MRIEVVRSGGFAAIERHAALDTAGRPDADRLVALAEAALTAGPARGPVVPDGFTYEITADGRTARCADPHLTAEQRELIRTVLGESA